ncbi:MAG: hypothetical protein HY361_01100 [Candidatus Aenigmarchaeota archaeon]|nr:hypothetical protein [Candidatus Aenigmarchaeota archaeon]
MGKGISASMIVLAVAVAAVVIFGGIVTNLDSLKIDVASKTNVQEEPNKEIKNTSPQPQIEDKSSKCVSNASPIFTEPFTDITKIRSIAPPGGIAVGSQSRSYVSAKAFENGSYPDVPIYAPIDSTLEGITYAMRGSSPKGRPEYRLDFRVSCEVTYSFDHIPYVIDKIKNAGPTTPANHTRTGAFVSIPVSAGEFIGYTDSAFVSGFDFYLFNYAKLVTHINPVRWTSDHNTHADCPYDYFPNELKTLYYSYFASAGGTKQDNPTCRSASRDVAGALSGGWFLGSSTDMQGSRLLVGSDFGDFVDLVIDRESQPRFSVRDYKGKNPEDVKAGDTVCYFDTDRNTYAYMKLLSDNELAASAGQGQCPGELPIGYEIWNR